MNGPPASESMEAVPSLTNRPEDVTGRDVPGRAPANAPSTVVPVPGRALDVPGRAKPVSGRPLAVTGRTPWFGIPFAACPVCGRARDVPGRGAWAVALSSIRISATPSSSISVSSIQFFIVSALHLMYHTAWSYGFFSRSSVQISMQSSYFRRFSLLDASQTGSIPSATSPIAAGDCPPLGGFTRIRLRRALKSNAGEKKARW
mmetsp:Transcript_24492/g.77432  ORF Transcript_24492/g.77432 Transcript_24492/m.77432 type:complete len:203 (+) Transcript_24492:1136-1744(+)